MPKIELHRIDESNFAECFNLRLGEGQDKFVSHPIRSLAQAYVYYNQCTPFGILSDGKMVGYVMVIYDWDTEEYNIWHLMIDASEQGKGYGKAAMLECLNYIRTKPFGSSDSVSLTCHEDNAAALHLYAELGFLPTGERDGEEIELRVVLA